MTDHLRATNVVAAVMGKSCRCFSLPSDLCRMSEQARYIISMSRLRQYRTRSAVYRKKA